MSKKKIPSDVSKSIKRIAQYLPPIMQMRLVGYDDEGEPMFEPVKQTQLLSGKEVLNRGREKTVDGLKVNDDDNFYLHDSDRIINHEKKLRKAYQQGGLPEMRKYIESIVDLKDSSNMNFMEVVKILNQIILYANAN